MRLKPKTRTIEGNSDRERRCGRCQSSRRKRDIHLISLGSSPCVRCKFAVNDSKPSAVLDGLIEDDRPIPGRIGFGLDQGEHAQTQRGSACLKNRDFLDSS